MSSFTHDLMVRGVAAARVGDKKEARFFLERLISLDIPLEEKLEAWFWLAKISDDPAEKRSYLEEVLVNNLGDSRARRELAILNGEIKVSEIVDPDRLSEAASTEPKEVDARRFTCPQCGGRMTYTADGQSLTCEYCESRQRLIKAVNPNQVEDSENFIAVMATARGHRKPVSMRTFHCEGCGALFMITAQWTTLTCPYCESSHVVKQAEPLELIEPHSIIPFSVDENAAKQLLLNWFKQEGYTKLPKVARGVCLYIPVWLFDVGGLIAWTYQVRKDRDTFETIRGQQPIFHNNILIMASSTLPNGFHTVVNSYNLNGLVSYKDEFLTDRVAQAYQISMGNASLNARQITLESERRAIRDHIPANAINLIVNTANMVVETFQLILLPLWLTHFDQEKKRIYLLINGQNAHVFSTSGPIPKP